MDTLIELAVAIISGGLGVVLFRLLKPKNVAKENQAVIVKVEEREKENDKLAEEISQILDQARKDRDALDKEAEKPVSNQEVDDFFNNRNK